MGLYLCVFADDVADQELDGVEVGSYDDFGRFRDTVARELESGAAGSRFPVLQGHHDSNGTWGPAEAEALERELLTIADELIRIEPIPFPPGWPREVAAARGLAPSSRLDCFVDIDGEPLVERLIALARVAQESGRPIWFQ